MKETNLLLGTYALQQAHKMSDKELDQFEALLEVSLWLFVSLTGARNAIPTFTTGYWAAGSRPNSTGMSCSPSYSNMRAVVSKTPHWMSISKPSLRRQATLFRALQCVPHRCNLTAHKENLTG
jgi:hypothetical protein